MLGPGAYYFFAATEAYIVGSCPNGYLVAKSRGIDIRQHGSGNIGATNVLRVVGKRWGYLVFFLDSLKGFLAVGAAHYLAVLAKGVSHLEFVGIVAGVACILGHTFPVWLKFRGGKGVATSAGVLLGLMPLAVLSVFIIWVVVFKMTRYVSVASLAAAASLPLFVAVYLWLHFLEGSNLLGFSILITGVVIWRHRSNIARLFRGTEKRFVPKQ
jgi:glycerol-3-phosphate acyltransferase PlsY